MSVTWDGAFIPSGGATIGTDIVALADVKTFLNIGTTTHDVQLAGFITTASNMWNRRVGPVTGVPAFDERYDGGGTTIALRQTPVLTVTSVVESWAASFVRTLTQQQPDSGVGSAYDYSFDSTTGQLTRRAMGVAVPFASGIKNVHVVYTAGYSTAPVDIQHAVTLLVAHLWETQRGRMIVPGQGGNDTWNPAMSFMWPKRVLEIADGYRVPGIG